MNVKGTILIISVLLFVGCATQLTYQVKEYPSNQESIEVVKRSLRHQSPNHGVRTVDVTPDYIKIEGFHNTVHYINFDYIAMIELHEKHEWKIVSIWDGHEGLMYRLYVTNERMARDFINAVYTLKNRRKHDTQKKPQKPEPKVTSYSSDDFSRKVNTQQINKSTIEQNTTTNNTDLLIKDTKNETSPIIYFRYKPSFLFEMCQALDSIALSTSQLPFQDVQTAINKALECCTNARSEMKQKYNMAKVILKDNEDGLKALKDLYVYWLGSMDVIGPQHRETRREYRRRINERIIGIKERENLMMIETQ